MDGFALCSECEKTELRIIDGPVSQGSTRIVKEPGNKPGDDGGAAGGSNVRRKEVSPFKDCTESDMVDRSGSSGKAHHEAAAVQWET